MKYVISSIIISITALVIVFGFEKVMNIIGPTITAWVFVAIFAAVLTGFSIEQFKGWRPWKR